MKKPASLVLSVLLFLSVFLAACSSSKTATTSETPAPSATPAATTTPSATPAPANDTPKPGGVVTFAYGQPFKGVIEKAWYGGEDDNLILNFSMDGLLKTGDDLKSYPNIASWTVSDDKKTFTFKFKEGVKWHNGEELTVEDWKFALEVLASKEYQEAKGPRYSNVAMIVGVEEYREGKAKEIAGIKVIDKYNIAITVKEVSPNTIDNLWSYPMPKKHFEGVAIKDMPASDQVRKNPVGLGPFKVKKVQPGEFVELERFDDYWQGKPLLDGVVFKTIDGKLSTSLIESGEVDIIHRAPLSQYKDLQKLTNIDLKEVDALGYNYIGFKLGTWDKKAEKVVNNPDSKFADKRLRQAMYYALDRQALLDAFSNGLGSLLAAPMPGVSWAKAPDDQVNAYAYDPEKAKKLLDEAGFKDVDGDGKREDQKGKKLTINFDAMSGSEISEPRAQAIMQMWHEVGLDVKLNGGALKELNLFYELVENDDPSVEVFMGGWGLASDPDPSGLWASTDLWNYPRWYNEESDRLIKEGISPKAADQEYRKQVYIDWQKLVNEEAPKIFLWAGKDLYPVNKRVQGVHANSFTAQTDPHKWWVKQ
jgi:peptide/nickel transport system substrate-binding protein